jgi:hypothetical protein
MRVRTYGPPRDGRPMRKQMGAAVLAAFAVAALSIAHGSQAAVPAPQPGHATLERRVEGLSKALDLDARQRAQLLVILQAQRAAVTKIWNDPGLSPAERAPATRAVEEHTADQIRSILSVKQRERYNPPKPQSAKRPPPDVGKWMELTRNSNEATK